MQDFKTQKQNLTEFIRQNVRQISRKGDVKIMARKGENIYKRKDGRYEGRYIKAYDTSGKPIWGYIYGKTYSETKERLNRKKVDATVKSIISPIDMTVSEWIEKWIGTQKHIKLSTKMMYHSHLKNHIQNSVGKIPLKRISESDIKEFVATEAKKYAPKTVHSVYSMLRLALENAHEKGYIGQICSGIKLPKINNTVLRVLSPKEQKQLEKVLLQKNSRYDIGILLCLYTGLRIGELCALKWENIDLKNGTLSVLKTVQRIRNEDSRIESKTTVFFAEPKSSSSVRVIPIPEFMVKMLKEYKRDDGFVLRDDSRFTDTRNISRRFKKTLEIAELPDMKFHILRHTFATRALELGIDVKTLSEILGHSSITITLNLYAHSLTEHKKKEMSKFNKLFKNPSN